MDKVKGLGPLRVWAEPSHDRPLYPGENDNAEPSLTNSSADRRMVR